MNRDEEAPAQHTATKLASQTQAETAVTGTPGVGPPAAPPPGGSVKERVKQNISDRFWMTLDYLSIFFFVALLYTFVTVTDFLLLKLFSLLHSYAEVKSPFFEQWYGYAQTGLASIPIILALVHSLLSAILQFKSERVLAEKQRREKAPGEGRSDGI